MRQIIKDVLVTLTVTIIAVWASHCKDDNDCSSTELLATMDVEIVPESDGALPEGGYDLSIKIGKDTVHAMWTINNGVFSPTSDGYTISTDSSVHGGIVVYSEYSCPESKLSIVEMSLSVDGKVVDEFSGAPVYGSDQPTEDKGAGCGECYRITISRPTLTVPDNV